MVECGTCKQQFARYDHYVSHPCVKANITLKELWEDCQKLYDKSEETKMEKVQMTEEQFKEMHRKIWGTEICNADLVVAKREGYIKKSELKTLVDEAENIYFYFQKYKYTSDQNILSTDDKNMEWVHYACKVMSKQYETIQALKKSHPEFNK